MKQEILSLESLFKRDFFRENLNEIDFELSALKESRSFRFLRDVTVVVKGDSDEHKFECPLESFLFNRYAVTSPRDWGLDRPLSFAEHYILLKIFEEDYNRELTKFYNDLKKNSKKKDEDIYLY